MTVVNGGFTFDYGVAYSFGGTAGIARVQSNSYAIPYRVYGIK